MKCTVTASPVVMFWMCCECHSCANRIVFGNVLFNCGFMCPLLALCFIFEQEICCGYVIRRVGCDDLCVKFVV